MIRRKFLQALGGTAVAATADDLVSPSDHAAAGSPISFAMPSTIDSGHRIANAKTALKQLIGKTDAQRKAEIRRIEVFKFTPNAYGLRSVNMQTKLAISRREIARQRDELSHISLRGILAGWWDY